MTQSIGICGIYRQHQKAGGVYSVVQNLLRGFAAVRRSQGGHPDFDIVLFRGSREPDWTDDQITYRQLADPGGRYPAETIGLWDSAGFDAILFPNFYTPPIVRAPRAVTIIHDLQYLHLPEHWPLGKRLWMRATHQLTLLRSDAVVAISQTVKNDILERYGARWESKVHAIWNPISVDRFSGPASQQFTDGRPYILCAAVDRPAKNLSTLIRAYAILRERFPEICLVLAGQLRTADRTWRRKSEAVESQLPSAADLVESLGLSKHVILTGYIPDSQLGALYRDALLFVLPSLFEGFGMPAVEALSLGTPTLISDLPVLREVTLGGANFITNPLDEHEMADRMAEIINRGDSARPTAEVRRDIRERFAPETIARQYLSTMLDRKLD